MAEDTPTKKNILIVGGGSVGAIAALNLELGGLARVTLVLRSNYKAVQEQGYNIESCDHGVIKGWKPSVVLPQIPTPQTPYDYILLITKNTPDIPTLPSLPALLSPALPTTNTHTTLLLLQNGLNIEKPFFASHPRTPLLSGISLIGSAEPSAGKIVQDDHDKLLVGAFPRPLLKKKKKEKEEEEEEEVDEEGKEVFVKAQQAAEEFARIYSAGGRTKGIYSPHVVYDRWKKLVYNACLNPICAITGLDTGRIRLADGALEGLVRPAMREIVAAARQAAGVDLSKGGKEDVVEGTVEIDPLEIYLKPSMLADVGKGNFIEHENLLGEPLREGQKAGVPMPTVEVLYNLAKAIQWRTMEEKGLVQIPPKRGSAAV